MLICGDLEAELYTHITYIAEQSEKYKLRTICMYIIYLLRLFKVKSICTKEDLDILTNCFVMINDLVFHPKPDLFNLSSQVMPEQKDLVNQMLISALN